MYSYINLHVYILLNTNTVVIKNNVVTDKKSYTMFYIHE